MKDPAFLFYSKDFYEGTRMMLPSERACYVDLLIYQHQNEFIPNDVERICMYCNGITQATLEATLKAKFKLCDKGWFNEKLAIVISERKEFSAKQSINGTVGQFWKKAKALLPLNKYDLLKIKFTGKTNLEIFKELNNIDLKNDENLKAMLEAMLKHLANEDVDLDKEYKKGNIEIFKEEALKDLQWLEIVGMQNKIHPDKINFALADFNKHLISQSRLKDVLSIDDYKRFFANWVRKRKEIQARQQN